MLLVGRLLTRARMSAVLVVAGAFYALPTHALTLSSDQLKLIEQLPASEKAKLAEQAGVLKRSGAQPEGALPGQEQPTTERPNVALEPEAASPLEQAYNNRLVGSPGVDASRLPPLAGNEADSMLRERLAESVGKKSRKIGQQLSQFGYHLFTMPGVKFVPDESVPVPAEYVLGPGDEIQIQYFGSRSDSFSLVVDREGKVNLPDVAAIPLAGLSFKDAKALLSERIHKALIGVTASITMGRLRTIRVFVLGDVRAPGSYVVGGLSTISHALFASGGISKKGSLRHVQLKRGGKVVRELDLYDLLLHGDSRDDVRLQAGDVVFVPPIGRTVAVAGAVVRPAIYEIKRERAAAELFRLAGGLLPMADTEHLQLDRMTADGSTLIDFKIGEASKQRIRDGDLLLVHSKSGDRMGVVSLFGRVKRPGEYGFHRGMRLSELIRSRDDLEDDAFLEYALIQRTRADQSLEVLRAPLGKLLLGDQKADLVLADKDRVIVLSKAAVQPLDSVRVVGEVVNPGEYPLTQGMHVLDLLLAAGGPTERAFLRKAELTRYEVDQGERRKARHFVVDLAAAMAGDAGANIALQANDVLMLRRIENWREAEHVVLRGEVKFPGEYAIQEGERLSDVLERAGGYTDDAYLPAAVFTRASIRQEQQEKLDEMAERLRGEIARLQAEAASLHDPKLQAQQQAGIAQAERMLKDLEKAKATGRLVIHLTSLDRLKGSDYDLRLRDGDELFIPKRPDQVLVMGQVYSPNALLYQKRLTVEDYIDRAGGLTRFADKKHIYVVHASGIVEPVRGGWHRTRIYPGDAIVVPEDVTPFNLLDSALDWSRVLYQIGVAMASMKVIGIL